jgi:hypothetical protein
LADFKDDDPNRGVPGVVRDFRPPDGPPHYTGLLWKNRNGSLGMTINDLLNWPIHLIGTLESGGVYHFRGWRGVVPREIHFPLIDGPLPPEPVGAVPDDGEVKEEE